MTNTRTVIFCLRPSLAASLLGAALLIGSARAGSAAEITAIPVSAPVSQAEDAGQATPRPAPAATEPAQPALPSVGAVGFGWG
jgi:hypothetical protein